MTQRSPAQRLDQVLGLAKGELATFVAEAHRTCGAVLKERFPELTAFEAAADREKALRTKLPDMLWHDLRRLRILRNRVEHEDFEPDEGDRDITLGTLKLLRTFLGVAQPNKGGTGRDWQAFQEKAKAHFEKFLKTRLLTEVGVNPFGETRRKDAVAVY